jgi:hypothetical protein
MSDFRTRRFQAGDENELNEVYNRVTGKTRKGMPRSLEIMRWVWHNAPGGPADSWVIEHQDSTGWKIIGHHALCPTRFTHGNEDWLCAKTMNTFLVPEFRDKFLYLRFEKECLKEADGRFDATYSIAPASVRLRKSLGYESYGNWIQFERGFQPLHLIYRTVAYFAGRYSYPARVRMSNALAAISAIPTRKPPHELTEHSAADAAASSFFADFGTEARREAGMAPRRDSADLEWRFWKHPGFTGTTLTYTWPEGGRAYFIVETSNPLLYALADFCITPANPQRFEFLLDALFIWCADQGALAIKCLTMAQGLPAQLLEVFLRKMKPFALQRFRPAYVLPRHFSPRGRARGGSAIQDWNATELLMPG